MNVQVVFQQMFVIVALVCLGIWMYKKQYISDEMTEKLSSIVVDVCNPMLCRIKREQQKFYNMMLVYANIGCKSSTHDGEEKWRRITKTHCHIRDFCL